MQTIYVTVVSPPSAHYRFISHAISFMSVLRQFFTEPLRGHGEKKENFSPAHVITSRAVRT